MNPPLPRQLGSVIPKPNVIVARLMSAGLSPYPGPSKSGSLRRLLGICGRLLLNWAFFMDSGAWNRLNRDVFG